jgi:hypothetical protein
MVDKPPTQDKILQAGIRPWELPEHRPNLTLSRAAYKPYSTFVLLIFVILDSYARSLPKRKPSSRKRLANLVFDRVIPKYEAWDPVPVAR